MQVTPVPAEQLERAEEPGLQVALTTPVPGQHWVDVPEFASVPDPQARKDAVQPLLQLSCATCPYEQLPGLEPVTQLAGFALYCAPISQ